MSWFVPGRIEVLGKHTDYAGGNVLVCAVEQGVTVTCTPASDGVQVESDSAPGLLNLHAGIDPALPDGHWGRYLQTVLDRLTSNFGPLTPCALHISSTLPLASGMSSSSALLSACALALADHSGFRATDAWTRAMPDPLSEACYLASIENGRSWCGLAGTAGVGTLGGSEDHAAMFCGAPGQLVQIGFEPPAVTRRVALPHGWTFAVAVSGVLAEKTGAARERYNDASRAIAAILQRWNNATGRQDAGLSATLADPTRTAALLADSPRLSRRFEHLRAESTEFVPAAADALAAGDLAAFGAIVDASQTAADTLLGNQVPQTIALATLARKLGAAAASSFGAGFGGSVWALVPERDAAGFAASWLDRYRRDFDIPAATSLITAPGGPARRLNER